MSITTFKEESTRLTSDLINFLLLHCVKADTSDVTIQSGSKVKAEIFGKLYNMTKRVISHSEVGEILNFLYGPNGTTQILSGKDIDTQYEFKQNRVEKYRFRVNATGCLVDGHDGIQITFRTIPTSPPLMDDLGIEADIRDNFTPESGIIYVTGSTGSGKSTLLASMIRNIIEDENGHRKVLTYEAPIEFVYDDVDCPTSIVSQSEIPRHLPSFQAGIRNALRRKPRLILVGEARDAETISASLEAALTGHPVYTTLHTNGVPETIRRLVNSFDYEEREGKTMDIIETLRLCISQKLVPSTDGKRVALREYLVINDKIRDELLDTNFKEITDKARKVMNKYGQTMAKAATIAFENKQISEKTFNLITKKGE
jgi:defect-in-organelle-trafficking protein DotB